MAQWRANYTPEEDAVIVAIVKEAQAERLPLSTAYMKAADELKRPVKSVTNRHRRLVKAIDGDTEGVKPLSEADKLVLRLKAMQRQTERSVEKSDIYKQKFEALQEEHDELKKKYRSLQIQHDNLIRTVKQVIGEDDGGSELEVG